MSEMPIIPFMISGENGFLKKIITKLNKTKEDLLEEKKILLKILNRCTDFIHCECKEMPLYYSFLFREKGVI